MQIQILRNNYEDINISMKVYADEVSKALKLIDRNIEINEINIKSPFVRFLTLGLNPFERFRNYYERYLLYPRKVKNLRSDIFHIIDHTYSYLLDNIDQKKTVVTCHDLILFNLMEGQFEGHRAPALASYLFKKAITHIKKAAKIISISENTKKDLIKYLNIPSEKIVTVHNGVNPIFFKEISQNESYLKKSDSFTILQIGRSKFYKNVEGIIKSISQVDKNIRHKIQLLKVGGHFTKKEKDLTKELGLVSQVTVLPYVPAEKLPSVYRSAHVLLFPSLYEGFGLPPIEAMASGIPVISSDRASLPEVCGDAAIYVNPLDHKEMALKIEQVLTDAELRKNLIEKGLKRAKIFTWEETARKTLEVYKEVLKAY